MNLAERVAAARAVPDRTGDGWMSRNARDMIRIAAFAGFDTSELIARVAVASNAETVNVATVERVMDEMDAEIVARIVSDAEEVGA